MLKLINKILIKLGLKKPPNPYNHYENIDFKELDNRDTAIRKVYESNMPKNIAHDTGKIVCLKCGKEQEPDDDFTFDVDQNGFLCDDCWRKS